MLLLTFSLKQVFITKCIKNTKLYTLNVIGRLRMVKNINFFWDRKKIFLTHWKTVFRATEHFCIKWTFWKNAFLCPKNAFFCQKWQFDPLACAARADVKELFFREVILHQFLKRKKWALLGKIVQAILTVLNLAQKVPFLEDLKKKVSKSDWNQRHIVYVTQIHYFTWF